MVSHENSHSWIERDLLHIQTDIHSQRFESHHTAKVIVNKGKVFLLDGHYMIPASLKSEDDDTDSISSTSERNFNTESSSLKHGRVIKVLLYSYNIVKPQDGKVQFIITVDKWEYWAPVTGSQPRNLAGYQSSDITQFTDVNSLSHIKRCLQNIVTGIMGDSNSGGQVCLGQSGSGSQNLLALIGFGIQAISDNLCPNPEGTNRPVLSHCDSQNLSTSVEADGQASSHSQSHSLNGLVLTADPLKKWFSHLNQDEQMVHTSSETRHAENASTIAPQETDKCLDATQQPNKCLDDPVHETASQSLCTHTLANSLEPQQTNDEASLGDSAHEILSPTLLLEMMGLKNDVKEYENQGQISDNMLGCEREETSQAPSPYSKINPRLSVDINWLLVPGSQKKLLSKLEEWHSSYEVSQVSSSDSAQSWVGLSPPQKKEKHFERMFSQPTMKEETILRTSLAKTTSVTQMAAVNEPNDLASDSDRNQSVENVTKIKDGSASPTSIIVFSAEEAVPCKPEALASDRQSNQTILNEITFGREQWGEIIIEKKDSSASLFSDSDCEVTSSEDKVSSTMGSDGFGALSHQTKDVMHCDCGIDRDDGEVIVEENLRIKELEARLQPNDDSGTTDSDHFLRGEGKIFQKKCDSSKPSSLNELENEISQSNCPQPESSRLSTVNLVKMKAVNENKHAEILQAPAGQLSSDMANIQDNSMSVVTGLSSSEIIPFQLELIDHSSEMDNDELQNNEDVQFAEHGVIIQPPIRQSSRDSFDVQNSNSSGVTNLSSSENIPLHPVLVDHSPEMVGDELRKKQEVHFTDHSEVIQSPAGQSGSDITDIIESASSPLINLSSSEDIPLFPGLMSANESCSPCSSSFLFLNDTPLNSPQRQTFSKVDAVIKKILQTIAIAEKPTNNKYSSQTVEEEQQEEARVSSETVGREQEGERTSSETMRKERQEERKKSEARGKEQLGKLARSETMGEEQPSKRTHSKTVEKEQLEKEASFERVGKGHPWKKDISKVTEKEQVKKGASSEIRQKKEQEGTKAHSKLKGKEVLMPEKEQSEEIGGEKLKTEVAVARSGRCKTPPKPLRVNALRIEARQQRDSLVVPAASPASLACSEEAGNSSFLFLNQTPLNSPQRHRFTQVDNVLKRVLLQDIATALHRSHETDVQINVVPESADISQSHAQSQIFSCAQTDHSGIKYDPLNQDKSSTSQKYHTDTSPTHKDRHFKHEFDTKFPVVVLADCLKSSECNYVHFSVNRRKTGSNAKVMKPWRKPTYVGKSSAKLQRKKTCSGRITKPQRTQAYTGKSAELLESTKNDIKTYPASQTIDDLVWRPKKSVYSVSITEVGQNDPSVLQIKRL